MSGDWRALASRLNTAAALEERAQEVANAARAKRLAEAREARDQLFAELEEFGGLLESVLVEVEREADQVRLVFRRGPAWLAFEHQGEGDRVAVSFEDHEGSRHQLYREPELGHRWVWSAESAGNREQKVLFNAGLQEMMTHLLGLPDPS